MGVVKNRQVSTQYFAIADFTPSLLSIYSFDCHTLPTGMDIPLAITDWDESTQ